MPSMSYCCFRNTNLDLQQCLEMINEHIDNEGTGLETLIKSRSSYEEGYAVKHLRELCQDILQAFEDLESYPDEDNE